MCLSWQNVSFVATKVCLPQHLSKIFLSQQKFCHDKYLCLLQKKFCHDKHTFVTTKLCLSWQMFCHDKSMFVATNILLLQQKMCFVTTNTCLSQQKRYLWQLPPMICELLLACRRNVAGRCSFTKQASQAVFKAGWLSECSYHSFFVCQKDQTQVSGVLAIIQTELGSPDWIASMVTIHLQKLLRVYCPGHVRVKGNDCADRLAGKTTITNGLHLSRSEVLRNLRHCLQTQGQEHHTINHLEERGLERGSARQSSLKGRKRAIVSQTNIGTISKATLGKHLRDGVEYIWTFLST